MHPKVIHSYFFWMLLIEGFKPTSLENRSTALLNAFRMCAKITYLYQLITVLYDHHGVPNYWQLQGFSQYPVKLPILNINWLQSRLASLLSWVNMQSLYTIQHKSTPYNFYVYCSNSKEMLLINHCTFNTYMSWSQWWARTPPRSVWP